MASRSLTPPDRMPNLAKFPGVRRDGGIPRFGRQGLRAVRSDGSPEFPAGGDARAQERHWLVSRGTGFPRSSPPGPGSSTFPPRDAARVGWQSPARSSPPEATVRIVGDDVAGVGGRWTPEFTVRGPSRYP